MNSRAAAVPAGSSYDVPSATLSRLVPPGFSGKHVALVVNTDRAFLMHRTPVARAAEALGARVTVVAADTGYGHQVEQRGFRFVPFPLSRCGANPASDCGTMLSLWRTYRSLQPDLVHHVTLKPVIYGSMAARLAAVPAVINMLTGLGYVFVKNGRSRALRFAVERMLQVASHLPRSSLILQNDDDLRLAREKNWSPAERISLIRGSGVDCSAFRFVPEPSGKPPLVLLASRMLRDKGVGEFVEAARMLARSRPQRARFVLVGPLDLENRAAISSRQLAQWEREGVVEWWGYRDDMHAVLAAANLVVLPTYYREGLPKVLLEAAATGRALIATNVPGCREVVRPAETGLLVPARNAFALARAIARLLDAPDLRARMGRQARNLAIEEFRIERVVAATMQLYAEALTGCSVPQPAAISAVAST